MRGGKIIRVTEMFLDAKSTLYEVEERSNNFKIIMNLLKIT